MDHIGCQVLLTSVASMSLKVETVLTLGVFGCLRVLWLLLTCFALGATFHHPK